MNRKLTMYSVLCGWLWMGLSACYKGETLEEPGTSNLIVSSTNIVPEMVYMDLQLEYSGIHNKTTATATFIYRNPFDTLDGARVRINSWNNITFNGVALPEAGNSAYYQRVLDGYVPEGDFVWTSWVLITYTNHVQMPKAGFKNAEILDLAANNYRLAWEGAPIDTSGGQDAAEFVFNKIDPSFASATPGDTAVVIDANKWAKLQKKDKWGKAFWQRSTERPLLQGTLLGGRIRTLYSSPCKQVADVLK